MKKHFKQYILLSLMSIVLSGMFMTLMAQQNQKILFPTPGGFSHSYGSYALPTTDGGYFFLGTIGNSLQLNENHHTRGIKTDGQLQVVWDNTYIDPSLPPYGIYPEISSLPLELSDGGFAYGVVDTSAGYDLIRLAPDGELLWGKNFPGYFNYVFPLDALANGSFMTVRSQLTTQNAWHSYVTRFNAAGGIEAEQEIEEIPSISAAVQLTGGDIVTMHYAQGNNILTRLDANSNIVWQSAPIANLNYILAAMADGGFGVVVHTAPNSYSVRFYDAQGNQTGQTPALQLPTSQIFSLGFYPDGSFLIAGYTSLNLGFMARIQQDGTVIWAAESPADGQDQLNYLSGHTTADGWAIGAGRTGTLFGALRVSENSGIFVNTISGKLGYDSDEDCALTGSETGIPYAQVKANNGTQNFYAFTAADGSYHFTLPAGDYTLTPIASQVQYTVCPDAQLNVSFPAGANGNASVDLPMQTAQILHQISGNLWFDQNNNCSADNGDIVLRNWVVRLQNELGTTISTGFTDINGHYSFMVSSGDYTVLAVPYNQNFSFCAPASQMLSVSGSVPQLVNADFVARAETDCAQMRASIQPTGIRPCLERNFYVNYRNDGAVPAEDATLEVILPPGVSYVSATPAPASVNGNVIMFELGQVLPSPGGGWNSVSIRVLGDCGLEIGDVVCIEANISPEEFCGEAPGWNGAIMTITGDCDGDNAQFTIKNIGNAANSVPLHYIIVEDQIVLLEGDVINLVPAAEEMHTVAHGNDTATIIMTLQQEPGFPGDTSVVFSLNNCMGMGGSPTGFSSNAGPFTVTKCLPVVNSYDPNDKNATPLGLGEGQSVRPGTPLEYTIRFQNTGNDTAFVVVIRDTLSPHFNAARTEVLGASHPYEFTLLSDHILHFTFNNIQLPDSTTNFEGSQGFVLFRAYPESGLVQGTVVENQAAIYFDNNEPIITNTVHRTYEDFILVKTDELTTPQALNINIYPNPFNTEATFELPEEAPTGYYALELYDGAGRQVRIASFGDRRCLVTRDELPAGLLFWKISHEGRMVASGKMIAQ